MPNSEEYSHGPFISNLLTGIFGISDDGLTVHRDGVATNNHVYMIHLAEPTKSEPRPKDASLKPFTCPIPKGTSRLVVRILSLISTLCSSLEYSAGMTRPSPGSVPQAPHLLVTSWRS
ncbi:hypothetical protein LMH87_007344 [Akanthomyces muscarius]|uniref:Uncharacterized protein n=1 Tax=Akanthomyces muscarius TaxID=2231603 RepID=A0A9W8QSM7_AKAMU|nr:hypothetical protein LMH87_007344 [Akanthomyces muscarius]KAJ4165724.1 hypothetical protein LMH87_007344 [Akanthomyces muscarius]